jgi:uncharacterized membrane-anchored protein YhcB (DUF1043 family)
MNSEPSNVEISVNELKLLVNTLSKSVALSLRKRFAWLWLIAGLLIGVSVALLVVNLTWKKADKTASTSQTILKKTDIVMSDLQKMDSDIKKLAESVNALNEKAKTYNAPQSSSKRKSIELDKPQPTIQQQNFMVYLHYSDISHKALMERFSTFLEDNGFKVSGIQKVNYKHQDIRYFHDQDIEGALRLKKYLIRFIQANKNLNENKIRIFNLSHKYPRTKKGLLEVWVDF